MYYKAAFLLLVPFSLMAEEVELLPVRSPTNPYSLEDVDSQVDTVVVGGKEYGAAMYRNPDDLTNGCHELTHAVSGRLRRIYSGKNGFYVLNNRAFIFKEPKIRISRVAAAILNELRNDIYQTYLIQSQQGWEFESLYLFDEHNAYINGSMTAKDYNIPDRLDGSNNNAYRMSIYTLYLLKEVHTDGGYDEYEDLRRFWLFQLGRLHSISSANQRQKFTADLTKDKNLIEWIRHHFTQEDINLIWKN